MMSGNGNHGQLLQVISQAMKSFYTAMGPTDVNAQNEVTVFTASEFQDMGYRMVIWPASAMRVAAKAQEELYAAIRRDGGTHKMLDRMQTRKELYEVIGYADYEALDASIIRSIAPQ